MTSCGTGGIWALTSNENVDDFFFGRTMIEDTTSTHKYFLQGFYSKYIPPLRSSKQLMRAVPKVSANYLEALERWDTGAVQSLLTQGIPRAWFWCTFAFLLSLVFAVVAPALTAGYDFVAVMRRPWDPNHIVATGLLYYSATHIVSVTLAAGAPVRSGGSNEVADQTSIHPNYTRELPRPGFHAHSGIFSSGRLEENAHLYRNNRAS